MSDKETNWYKNVVALLTRHGYDLSVPGIAKDISVTTGLSEDSVRALLSGDSSCTVEALCRLADVLHAPPGELLNINPSLTRIYAIDGSAPITVVLPPQLATLQSAHSTSALFYAGGLDDSYANLPSNCIIVCSRGMPLPEVNKLYLFENDRARFVRRCVSINPSVHEATYSADSGDEGKLLVVTYEKMKLVTAQTPLVVGTVICSIVEH